MTSLCLTSSELMDAVSRAVHAKGFPSLTAYADSRPVAALAELADQLGPDVEPLDLEQQLIAEAEAAGEMERCARSLLARDLRAELPGGWAVDAAVPGSASHELRMSGVFFALSMALPRGTTRRSTAFSARSCPRTYRPGGFQRELMILHWSSCSLRSGCPLSCEAVRSRSGICAFRQTSRSMRSMSSGDSSVALTCIVAVMRSCR